jgi:cellulose synthase/poly-beta-1,6-N-acetylglucosamine synthase-like glycosyltransferase
MLYLLTSTVLLGLAYFCLILYFLYHWSRLRLPAANSHFFSSTTVSIIVPARNEAANIETCLRAILNQEYPGHLMEVIVIDDHSEDETANIVKSIPDPRIRLITLVDYPIQGQAYKKHGIQTAVQQSRGTLILCTDADCQMGPNWLHTMVAFFDQEKVQMLAGPVNFHQEKNLLERFQSLDFLGMMLLTGAGLQSGLMRMGNGANLAYTRTAFDAVGGFSGVDQLASGDDLFLMHKIEQSYPEQVKFLKSLEATVYTRAMPDWKAFFQQRLRWGTKNAAYQEWQITAVLGLVFGLCWAIIGAALLSIVLPGFKYCLLILLLAKIGADYLLLKAASTFFQRKDLLRVFWRAQILHILYIAFIGLWVNVHKQYEWKGRQVK